MNKRQVGGHYEQLARDYLISNGLSIAASNYRNRFGEIDLVCKDKEYYVFVEVKYRHNKNVGLPIEAVDIRKQYKICRVADYFRISRHLPDNTCIRFDVVTILDEEITWYKNAFDYIQ